MKKIGMIITLALTSILASANTCEINLANDQGDILESMTASGSSMDQACNYATEDCEVMLNDNFEDIEHMYCDNTKLINNFDKNLAVRSCTAKLTGPLGRITLGRYTSYGRNSCNDALRKCKRDSIARRRGVTRCVIEYRNNRRGRRGNNGRGGRRGGRRGGN